ncbi:MAG: ABC transporter ATP-binding protein [Nitrososphaeria archaeon]
MEIVKGEKLSKHYNIKLTTTKSNTLTAVSNINITINGNEIFGLVGESGSGKSTLGRLLLWLEKPSSGTVSFKGLDLTKAKKGEIKEARRKMQVVFQNPDSSLDPRMKIKKTLLEALECSHYTGDYTTRVKEVLEDVGLRPDVLDMYPHHLSGGMKQRIAVARAILAEPEFIVLDEPTSALDVSVQAQILNLLEKLQGKLNLSYLFISHSLSIVSYISHRVGVMYLGKLVELGTSEEVFGRPLHPYSQLLISSVPSIYLTKRLNIPRHNGNHEHVYDVVKGCKFHPRCPYADELCRSEEPKLSSNCHMVACHYAIEIEKKVFEGGA